MFTVCSLKRDTRFKQAQKLQILMVIRASKSCKVCILLNLSMCYSGYFLGYQEMFLYFS